MVRPQLVAFGLVFLRTSSLTMMVPVLGGEAVPLRIRGAVAAILAAVLTPVAGPFADTDPLVLIAAAVGEVLLGIALGTAVRLTLSTAEMGGELVGMSMGFGFARIVDPMTHEDRDVVAQLMGLFTTLLFISVDGHHMVLGALGATLREVPLGTVLPRLPRLTTITPMLQSASLAAIRIAAPVVLALLLSNGALALLSRVAPQLNLFALSFALGIGVGTLVLIASSGQTFGTVVHLLRQIPQQLATLVGA